MEKEVERWDTSLKKNYMKGAALAVMFTLGTGAFADKGSLFDSKSNNFDMKAVHDVVEIMHFAWSRGSGRELNSADKEHISRLQEEFDKKYGEGSLKYIAHTMNEYAKTPGGKALLKTTENGVNPIKEIATISVRRAAIQEKSMKILNSKNTLADYEYSR